MVGDFRSRAIFSVGLCAAAIAALVVVWNARHLLLVLFAGVVGGLLLSMPTSWLETRFRWRRGLALSVVLAAIFGTLAALIALRGPALVQQIGMLHKDIPQAAQAIMASLQEQSWSRWVLAHLMESVRSPNTFLFAVSGLRGVMSITTWTLAALVVVFFISLFLAIEPGLYLAGLRRITPARHRLVLNECLETARVTLQAWLVAKALSMVIIGSMVALGLWILRTPLPGTLGILAGLLTFIPNIGPIVSVIPAALLAFAISPGRGVLTLALFAIVHFLEGNVVTPLAERTIVRLPPALTLAVQLLLASTTGLLGIAMAAPLTAVLVSVIQVLLPREPVAASAKSTTGRAAATVLLRR